MYVLSRKIDQRIVIAKTITVAVLGINGDRVMLGFNAPDDVGILREELSSEVRSHRPHRKSEGMLVITRKVGGEGVVIDQNITVRVLGAFRGKAKIGTMAPYDVKIEKGEPINEGRARGSRERF